MNIRLCISFSHLVSKRKIYEKEREREFVAIDNTLGKQKRYYLCKQLLFDVN